MTKIYFLKLEGIVKNGRNAMTKNLQKWALEIHTFKKISPERGVGEKSAKRLTSLVYASLFPSFFNFFTMLILATLSCP